MDTSEKTGGISMYTGGGNGSGNGSTGSNGSQTTSTVHQTVKKESVDFKQDLYVVGAILIAISLAYLGFLYLIKLFKQTLQHTATPQLEDIWLDDPHAPNHFAAQMFEEEGQENRHFADQFANDFLNDENSQLMQEATEQHFVQDFFNEDEQQRWREDLAQINRELEERNE